MDEVKRWYLIEFAQTFYEMCIHLNFFKVFAIEVCKTDDAIYVPTLKIKFAGLSIEFEIWRQKVICNRSHFLINYLMLVFDKQTGTLG